MEIDIIRAIRFIGNELAESGADEIGLLNWEAFNEALGYSGDEFHRTAFLLERMAGNEFISITGKPTRSIDGVVCGGIRLAPEGRGAYKQMVT